MKTFQAPSRRPQAGRTSARPSRLSTLGRRAGSAAIGFAVRRPGVVLAVMAAAGGASLFSWNALMQQPVRHPAPLFVQAKPDPARVEPPRRPDLAAAPVPRGRAEAAPTTPGDTPVKLAAADPIGALIRASENPSRAAEPVKPDPARVAAAQKALLKLGYGPLKPDGVLGTTTRQAVEKFERDRNLPVSTGSIAPRTAKQLSAASGLAIE